MSAVWVRKAKSAFFFYNPIALIIVLYKPSVFTIRLDDPHSKSCTFDVMLDRVFSLSAFSVKTKTRSFKFVKHLTMKLTNKTVFTIVAAACHTASAWRVRGLGTAASVRTQRLFLGKNYASKCYRPSLTRISFYFFGAGHAGSRW